MKALSKANKITKFDSWKCDNHDSHSYIIPDKRFWRGQSHNSNAPSRQNYNHDPIIRPYRPGLSHKFKDGSTITLDSVSTKKNE